ncbi:hypothetical protein BC830DRAFT_1076879 [Chytriomyces sp. MP71]|nr:hypothetical protein BC830DRAFT_1076879 [Chytriomyces sp. MP71]
MLQILIFTYLRTHATALTSAAVGESGFERPDDPRPTVTSPVYFQKLAPRALVSEPAGTALAQLSTAVSNTVSTMITTIGAEPPNAFIDPVSKQISDARAVISAIIENNQACAQLCLGVTDASELNTVLNTVCDNQSSTIPKLMRCTLSVNSDCNGSRVSALIPSLQDACRSTSVASQIAASALSASLDGGKGSGGGIGGPTQFGAPNPTFVQNNAPVPASSDNRKAAVYTFFSVLCFLIL